MQQVITEKQARAITGGRKPLVPVVYEQAVKALAECLTLDDAKQWDSKADALAAWAKIYRDGQVERQARALKLLAYRRMGELAAELRHTGVRFSKGKRGPVPGAKSLLIDSGLNPGQARAAVSLSQVALPKFKTLTEAERPLSPRCASNLFNGSAGRTDTFRFFMSNMGPSQAVSLVHRCDPKTTIKDMRPDEVLKAVERVKLIAEWCDEFLHHAERAAGLFTKDR